jgi:hypothetical protein
MWSFCHEKSAAAVVAGCNLYLHMGHSRGPITSWATFSSQSSLRNYLPVEATKPLLTAMDQSLIQVKHLPQCSEPRRKKQICVERAPASSFVVLSNVSYGDERIEFERARRDPDGHKSPNLKGPTMSDKQRRRPFLIRSGTFAAFSSRTIIHNTSHLLRQKASWI